VRKLIGSKKKGKRLQSNNAKEASSVDKSISEEQLFSEYSDDDLLLGEYSADDMLPGEYSADDLLLGEYSADDLLLSEYSADDDVLIYGDDKEKNRVKKSGKKETPAGDEAKREMSADDAADEEPPADETEKKKHILKKVKLAKRPKRPLGRRHLIYASMILIGIFFVAAALRVILSDVIEDAVARGEYDQLREDFPNISGMIPEYDDHVPHTDDGEEPDVPEPVDELRELSLAELAAINNDFIGWINANNSIIDYPIVRGRDNEKYINTTFSGTRNSAGTIFMDYRNDRAFEGEVVILFGHRTRDGSMFTTLVNHLDPEYQRRNPNINILTRDGRRLTYVVFAAKLTDAWDPAYAISVSEPERAAEVFPNVPENASRFLVLSTCTSSSNDDERILVFAALS